MSSSLECSVLIEIIKGFEDRARKNNDICRTNLGNFHKTCQMTSDFYRKMEQLRIETEAKCISAIPK